MESDGPISGGNLHNGDEKIKFIVHSFLKEYGFLSHVINSINDAYAFGIPTIITKQFPVKEIYYASERRGNREVSLKSKDLEYITFELIAESAEVGKPTREINGKYVPDFPNECKKNDRPYVGPINTTYTLKMSALTKGGSIKEKESVTMTVTPTKLPIVVKSNRCNLEHFSMSELYAVGENPLEDGGVLVNGVNSYAIDCIEKTNPYNAVNTYYEKEHAGIFVHSNVLSKPGIGYENSYETRVILMNTGDIKVVLGFGAFRGVEIPFFIFFRLLNVCSDLDIVKYILSTDDIESLANKQLLNIILRGFQVVEPEYEEFKTLYNPIDIRDKLVNEIFKPDNKLRLREEVLSILDTYLLPHMGDKPEHRHKKLFFLGFMIKKTLMVALDKSLQTNRDALNEKLVQTPGELFSQNFIKDYNKYFIKAVKKRFDDIVHKTPFEDIDLKDAFEVICKNNKLEKKLILSLSSGSVENESTGKKASGNTRYQTQRLYMAPDISLKNACRIIRIAKSSALGKKTRSNVVRETRPSYAGFIDMTQTHDTGDNVGTVKALALTCFITGRGDTHIREILMKDITPESDDLKISDRQGGMVQLNGEIIGYTDNIMDLYNKYHKYKLERKIDRFTGIHCLIQLDHC
jgi:DNA-directed RNA polymerase II subunit RPB2